MSRVRGQSSLYPGLFLSSAWPSQDCWTLFCMPQKPLTPSGTIPAPDSQLCNFYFLFLASSFSLSHPRNQEEMVVHNAICGASRVKSHCSCPLNLFAGPQVTWFCEHIPWISGQRAVACGGHWWADTLSIPLHGPCPPPTRSIQGCLRGRMEFSSQITKELSEASCLW